MDAPSNLDHRLVRRLHTAFDGTPYFDEELQVAQSTAHRIMATECVPILAGVAAEAGLSFLSDEPIWYLQPETGEQKAYYGDGVFARSVDTLRITADDLLLVLEIVSTNDRRKEVKDTRFQRLLNECHGVPEFALVFPELEDGRALTWCRLVDNVYQDHVIAPGGHVASESVPGLELHVLPRERWAPGYKIDVWYQGQRRPRLAEERARAEQERSRAEQERSRADQERARAEQERTRAERFAARLRELGVDPES